MTLKAKKRIRTTLAITAAFLLMAAGGFTTIQQGQMVTFAADENEQHEQVENTDDTENVDAESFEEEKDNHNDSELKTAESGEMRVAEAFMEIDTTALDKESQTHSAKATKEVTIVDTVTYTGAAPDDDYHMEATLMDKATGKAVTVDGKTVTAQQSFDPDDYDGTVVVEITFDASELGGHDVVVFEKVINDSAEFEEVAHEDINDGDQTVNLIDPSPIEKVLDEAPKTGDTTKTIIAVAIAFAALAGAVVTFVARRKKV